MIVLASCQKEDGKISGLETTTSEVQVDKNNSINLKINSVPNLSRYSIIGTNLSDTVENYIVNHIDSAFTLDTNNTYIAENTDIGIKSIVTNFDSSNYSGGEKIILLLEESGSSHIFHGGYRFSSTTINHTTTTNIFHLNGSPFFTYEANSFTQEFDIDIHNYTPDASDPVNCTPENVLGCIEHAYTELGWTSVLLWAATLVDPAVGVTVAVSCIMTWCVVIPIMTGTF